MSAALASLAERSASHTRCTFSRSSTFLSSACRRSRTAATRFSVLLCAHTSQLLSHLAPRSALRLHSLTCSSMVMATNAIGLDRGLYFRYTFGVQKCIYSWPQVRPACVRQRSPSPQPQQHGDQAHGATRRRHAVGRLHVSPALALALCVYLLAQVSLSLAVKGRPRFARWIARSFATKHACSR